MPKKRTRRKDGLELVYKLTGNVREVNVFELAPALLGLGEILQEANRALGNESEISVNVRPFAPGSFIADIVLYAHSNVPLLLTAAEALRNLETVLKSLGLVKGAVVSVIAGLRKLGAKPTKVEQIAPNQYRYSADNNNSITVDGDVHALMQNAVIHNHFYNVLGRPTQHDNIDGLETFLADAEEETKVTVTKQDAAVLKEYSESTPPQAEGVKEVKNIADYYLKPKRISVEGEPDNWSFRIGREKDILKVDVVRDQDFLDKVRRGTYKLTKDDLLLAEVTTTQKVSGQSIISSSIELTRVKEYTPATPKHPPERLV